VKTRLMMRIVAGLWCSLAMGLCSFAWGTPPTSTAVVTLQVGSSAEQPPAEDFMNQQAINPSANALKAQAAQTVNAAPVSEPSNIPPVPSYRTLGAAAAAGVNPLAHRLEANTPRGTPVNPSRMRRLTPYILLGGGFALLLGMVYVVLSRRLRRTGPA